MLLDNLPALIQSLLIALAAPVVIDGQIVETSSSIGVCWLGNTIAGRSDLLHRADVALYEAKRERRGSARVHGERRLIAAAGSTPARLAR